MPINSTCLALPLGHCRPQVDEEAFVAPTAAILGAVQVAARASAWYGCVLRADTEPIVIGEASNVQDGVVIHTDRGYPATIGRRVSIGHRAVLHGCTVKDDVLVGMGAVVLNGARIGAGSLIAAGAVVLEDTEIPSGSLVTGVPGKVRRETSEAERAHIQHNAELYIQLSDLHATALEAAGRS